MGKNSGGSGSGGSGGATKEAGLSSLPAAQARGLAKIESGIRGNNYESAAIVDEKGKVLLNKKGEAHAVPFTKDEVAKMKGNMLTHNHPSDMSFSKDDFDLVAAGDLKGIRAVGKKNTYTLIKPEGMDWSRATVRDTYKRARASVLRQYKKDPSIDYSTRVSQIAASKLGWKFTKTTK